MGVRLGGRQKGTPNKATTELAARFRAFVEDPKAVERMRREYRAGNLNPMLVKLFFEYAYGKPKEQVELTGRDGGPIEIHDHFAVPAPGQ